MAKIFDENEEKETCVYFFLYLFFFPSPGMFAQSLSRVQRPFFFFWTEMAGLESQEEDAPKRILFFKPMSWLGQIRSHRRDEALSPSLRQTFFVTSMVTQIPVLLRIRTRRVVAKMSN
jgi:hypothetical protein